MYLRSVIPARVRHRIADTARAARGPDRGALRELRRATRALAAVPDRRKPDRPLDTLPSNSVERSLAEALARYGEELRHLRAWARMRNERAWFPATGMYDWIEAQILYLLLRHLQPTVVVEISPNFGYSTGVMLLALHANRHGTLWSFDLEDRFHHVASRTFDQAGIDRSRQRFVAGDVRRNQALPATIDVLFMDSDHSYDFARWYQSALIPRVRPGGLVHVHDVLRYGVLPHQGDYGEGRALAEYLRESAIAPEDHFFTSEFVRSQPLHTTPLDELERYPFGEHDPRGTNNIEQNASFWMVVR